MRRIVTISLPLPMVRVVEQTVKNHSYASKSEFFRMLLRLWMEGQLKEELEESRAELRSGKGKLRRSLKISHKKGCTKTLSRDHDRYLYG